MPLDMKEADKRLTQLEQAYENAQITHRQLAALAFMLGCEYMRDVLTATNGAAAPPDGKKS